MYSTNGPENNGGVQGSLKNLPGNSPTTPLQLAAKVACLEITQVLVEYGAVTHKHEFEVPMGADGDLVAGFLQGHGSKPVKRT